ncbi:hypothetical protein ACVUP5_005069, partial [Escherichia coli]
MADSPFLWRDITSYRVHLFKIIRNKLQETLASDVPILSMINCYSKLPPQHNIPRATTKTLKQQNK